MQDPTNPHPTRTATTASSTRASRCARTAT